MIGSRQIRLLSMAALLAAGMAAGCRTVHPERGLPPNNNMPRELAKTTLPPYTIEPPDILLIEAIRIVPKSPYKINTLDVLDIRAPGSLPPPARPESPTDDLGRIFGEYAVAPGGAISLGLPYGSLNVVGMTLDEVKSALEKHLAQYLADPSVSVTLSQFAGNQSIAGEHLVTQDGTVTLGVYGSVFVVGMTLEEARTAIEAHLSSFLEEPQIAVNVFAYNSKQYYIITQGAGMGDGVRSFPITGNETVLDAIAQINGLTSVSSKKIWIARPQPGGAPLKLCVNWHDITANGLAETNYQILPGDRVFVQQDRLVAFDSGIGKVTAPLERIFGFTQLGTSTVSSIKFFNRFGNNQGGIFIPPP